MASFAIHNAGGDIDAVVTSSAGAPPVAAADPGQFVSEIELPEELSDLASSEDDQRAAESLKGYRVQGRMMRRS
jgi:hypothetical protein